LNAFGRDSSLPLYLLRLQHAGNGMQQRVLRDARCLTDTENVCNAFLSYVLGDQALIVIERIINFSLSSVSAADLNRCGSMPRLWGRGLETICVRVRL